MSFTKFVSLLTRKALFFARADKLGDPFEGSLSQLNVDYGSTVLGIPEEYTTLLHNHIKDQRRFVLNQSQGGNYMDSGIKTGLRVSEEFLGGFSFMYFSPWC